MGKRNKLVCAVVLSALIALCLAACGGGSGSGSGSGSAASNSGSNAKSYDPIYVVKHATIYGQTIGENGSVTESFKSASWDYEYDEQGNRTKWVAVTINPQTKESQTSTYAYSDYDENGYAGSSVAADGSLTTTEWTIEDGHATKSTSSSGASCEYAYYADGKLKSTHVKYDDGRDITVEYDENGRPAHQVTVGGDYPQTVDFAWTLDDQGRATGMTRTTTMTQTGNVNSTEYTFDLDENGNITTVHANGAVAQELEYQKIDNPSTNAWVNSWIQQI